MGDSKLIDIPKVSVIIPVFNTEAYVSDAIRSIVEQSLEEIEIIIVNDGSTDDSLSVLEFWASKESRIKLFSQENKGLSLARNTGLSHARGRYIYFMDSDDILLPNALLDCYKVCQEGQLDFTFFDALPFSDSKQVELLKNNFHYTTTSLCEGKVYTGLEALRLQVNAHEFKSSVCILFISREFIQNNRMDFYPKIIHEDQLFTINLYLKSARLAYIKRIYFHRRVREESIMSSCFSLINMTSYFTVATVLIEKEWNVEERALLNKLLTQMLSAAVQQAYQLVYKERYQILKEIVKKWKKYVSVHSVLVLMCKKHI